ncbi:hypothetical protein CEXT_250081 [Caerostris extrusa]|uniref:Uncharacterized protein n=1 Tax=Caerostris extrusa TaxID=172846 RepID=A0AAV4XG36_CAEEX|nr:hypothetical protein CEXT_250081 [Caerostris extrusa]
MERRVCFNTPISITQESVPEMPFSVSRILALILYVCFGNTEKEHFRDVYDSLFFSDCKRRSFCHSKKRSPEKKIKSVSQTDFLPFQELQQIFLFLFQFKVEMRVAIRKRRTIDE